MATKEDWKEFFELINGHAPTLADFTAAKASGEIDTPSTPTPQVPPVVRPAETPAQEEIPHPSLKIQPIYPDMPNLGQAESPQEPQAPEVPNFQAPTFPEMPAVPEFQPLEEHAAQHLSPDAVEPEIPSASEYTWSEPHAQLEASNFGFQAFQNDSLAQVHSDVSFQESQADTVAPAVPNPNEVPVQAPSNNHIVSRVKKKRSAAWPKIVLAISAALMIVGSFLPFISYSISVAGSGVSASENLFGNAIAKATEVGLGSQGTSVQQDSQVFIVGIVIVLLAAVVLILSIIAAIAGTRVLKILTGVVALVTSLVAAAGITLLFSSFYTELNDTGAKDISSLMQGFGLGGGGLSIGIGGILLMAGVLIMLVFAIVTLVSKVKEV
ncbi:MAG: hypothetical protein LBI43_00130 [Streptococcaceae bacterium]|jgi:hypothetical protein|nr:hypothetical protein [Streptococcaceae bacterium]